MDAQFQSQPQSPGLKLEDIYFVLFRRKWLILLLAAAGIAAAAIVYLTAKPQYQSEAKLIVRYVMDSSAPLPPGTDDSIRTPVARADSVINTEIEILTSWDLARKVAETVTPARIFGTPGPHSDVAAARAILLGLTAGAPGRGNVITVAFSHSDPDVAQTVLKELVAQYLERHVEIHRSTGTYEFLSRQTDQLRSRLTQTEESLRTLKNRAGVISLEDSKLSIIKQLETIQATIFETEALLAQQQALLRQNPTNLSERALTTTNSLDATAAGAEGVPSSVRIAYQAIVARLQGLRTKESEYAARFTADSQLTRALQEQLREAEEAKTRLEREYPSLARLAAASSSATASGLTFADPAQAAALQAKISVLTNQLAKVRAEAATLDSNELSIVQKEREKELQANLYEYLAKSLEQARMGEALDLRKVPNISVAQTPSPPQRNHSGLKKVLLGLLAAGFGGGIGLAFLLEFYLDPRIKRASEFESKIPAPFYQSIPDMRADRRERGRFRANPKIKPGSATAELAGAVPAVLVQPWDSHHPLHASFEALSDRIILFFERIKLTRKPKLVGVVGSHEGAGASTIAAGLAGTLSETGGGKVLLVDLTGHNGAAHPFFEGKPERRLFEVLDANKQLPAEDGDRLVFASVGVMNGDMHPARTKAFDALIPKLKTSEFDYIVFDLPPLCATSIGVRMAGYLDQVLVVAEAEKTNRESLKRALGELQGADGNAKIAVVLNKSRTYLPSWMGTGR